MEVRKTLTCWRLSSSVRTTENIQIRILISDNMCYGEKHGNKGNGQRDWGQALLAGVMGEGFFKEVAFEQRLR